MAFCFTSEDDIHAMTQRENNDQKYECELAERPKDNTTHNQVNVPHDNDS